MPSVLGANQTYMPPESQEGPGSAMLMAEQAFSDANDLANRVASLVERLAGPDMGLTAGSSDESPVAIDNYLAKLRLSANTTSYLVRVAHRELDRLEGQL